jgi:hypothetical protein
MEVDVNLPTRWKAESSQLSQKKSYIWVLFCKDSTKPNPNSLNIRCFDVCSKWLLFYKTSHCNPTGVRLYLSFVFVFCNLRRFMHVIAHILIFLKSVRFLQIDLLDVIGYISHFLVTWLSSPYQFYVYLVATIVVWCPMWIQCSHPKLSTLCAIIMSQLLSLSPQLSSL